MKAEDAKIEKIVQKAPHFSLTNFLQHPSEEINENNNLLKLSTNGIDDLPAVLPSTMSNSKIKFKISPMSRTSHHAKL